MIEHSTYKNRIVIDQKVHFGKPCVARTRIPVDNVLELAQENVPFDEIINKYYPDLEIEDINACASTLAPYSKEPFLKEIVECYKNHLGDNLISLVLFGSRARGDARETSDYDLFPIAKELPVKPFRRKLFIRAPLKGQFEEKLSIVAKTPEEALGTFPSFFLDLSLDGIIFFDRDQFFTNFQTKVKEIISQAGLQRKEDNGEYYWEWKSPPKGGWEITWSGYREL